MDLHNYFITLKCILFFIFHFNEIKQVICINSETSGASTLEISLTALTLNPLNSDLENKIYKQFNEHSVIEISFPTRDISFRIVVTCVSDCPAEWSFDNMRHMYESSSSPHIFPSRIFGTTTRPFRSDLVIQATLSSNRALTNIQRASLLTGKYTCRCSTNSTTEKSFHAYFESNPDNPFVNSQLIISLRPEPGDKWIGLGCATQIPNIPISLWKRMEYTDDSGERIVEYQELTEGDTVRRDASQGFVVAVDAENSDYRCDYENTTKAVYPKVKPIRWTGLERTPVLTLNHTTNEYKCCLEHQSPAASFINCNNKDECNFLALRRLGNFLPTKGPCVNSSITTKCCYHSIPRVGGLLRCVNPFARPFLSSSMMVEDLRPISKKPEISRDLGNEEELILQCIASSFTFSNYLYWELQLWNGTILSLKDSGAVSADYLTPTSTHDDIAGTITSKIQIPDDIEVEKATCSAPIIGSTEWRNDTLRFEQSVGPLGEAGPAIIIAGSLTALIIGVLFVSICLRLLKPPRVLTDEDIQQFLEGTAAKSTESTLSLNEICLDELESENIYEDLLRLPYNKDFEFPRSSFNYDKKSRKLGEGAFGSVYPGKLKVSGHEESDVAIKMIITNVTRDKLKSILAEIKIMSYVGFHTNVVNLKGANTRQLHQNKILMAIELCSGGSLEEFITKNKCDFNRETAHGYDSRGPSFTTRTLLKWAQDIADGMSFLSSKKVIHVDLATRNIFLTDTLIPKIGDFGLSRRLYTKEIYLKKSEGYLPIYWMSLESLKTLTFSTQSDVWSYGVTIWEMFALSHDPYETRGNSTKPTWDQLEMFLDSGKRLFQPQHASVEIYAIMLQCWNSDPSMRPSFDVLKHIFLDEVEKLDRFAISQIEASVIPNMNLIPMDPPDSETNSIRVYLSYNGNNDGKVGDPFAKYLIPYNSSTSGNA